MAKYRITGPDGASYEVTAPDGASEADVLAYAQKNYQGMAPAKSGGGIGGAVRDLAAGAVRGAGSIGATVMAPLDVAKDAFAGKGLTLESNQRRRADMDEALVDLTGADPKSLSYGAGKLGAEIAGTLPVGGLLAKPVQALAATRGAAGAEPLLQGLAQSLASGGFRVGELAGTGAGALTRAIGGATTGGLSAALVNPADAVTGAVVGGVTPGILQGAGATGAAAFRGMRGASERLMQSAIKPTIAQLKSGDAGVAVKTLLDLGINPTEKGVSQLRQLADDLESRISADISSSTATIPKQNVLARLAGTRDTFTRQVSPAADLAAIQRVADDFAAHPAYPGADLPVQAAQDLKRGTYNVLARKYGQLGTAETEAQKGLARGLKEEISAAVPGVADMNNELGRLITTMDVAERRALMELNKNPMGLAALAQSPSSWAMFMADKSALFKALAARALNAATPAAPKNRLAELAGPGVLASRGAAGTPALPNNRMMELLGLSAPVAAVQD